MPLVHRLSIYVLAPTQLRQQLLVVRASPIASYMPWPYSCFAGALSFSLYTSVGPYQRRHHYYHRHRHHHRCYSCCCCCFVILIVEIILQFSVGHRSVLFILIRFCLAMGFAVLGSTWFGVFWNFSIDDFAQK